MSDQDVLSGSDEDPAASAPAGLSPPGPEDLLGRRSAAALVDLAGLAGLGVIMSVAARQTTVSNTGFMISLDAAWTGVLTAAALLYYFALETWAGQTLGSFFSTCVSWTPGGHGHRCGQSQCGRCCGSSTGCRCFTWPASSPRWPPAPAGSGSAIWRPER